MLNGQIDYRVLYIAQHGLCFYCGVPMNPKCDGKHKMKPHSKNANCRGWTRDHFYPRKDGHRLTDNVVLSCSYCNLTKSGNEPSTQQIVAFAVLRKRYAEIAGCRSGYGSDCKSDYEGSIPSPAFSERAYAA